MDAAKMAHVLGHQLKGIMLHVDLFKAYVLHENKRCAMKHFRHVMAETKNFMLTNEYFIESIGDIVEPENIPRIVIPAEEEKLHGVWQQWEHDTMSMYHELMVENPKCCWWKKLHCDVMKEISTAY